MSTHLSDDNLANDNLANDNPADHHLPDGEPDEWQAGERSAERARHVAECAECHRSVGRMEEVLALFGETARAWSADRPAMRQMRAVPVPGGKRISGLQRGWVWTAAVAMLLLVLSGGTWVSVGTWLQHQQAARERQLASDGVLLQQVDEDISQVVPEALAPLGQVAVSSDSNSSSPK
jgi:hypothetical protein